MNGHTEKDALDALRVAKKMTRWLAAAGLPMPTLEIKEAWTGRGGLDVDWFSAPTEGVESMIEKIRGIFDRADLTFEENVNGATRWFSVEHEIDDVVVEFTIFTT